MLTSTLCVVYLLFLNTVYGFSDSFVNQNNVITDEADISISSIQEELEKVLPQEKDSVDARCALCKFMLNYLDTYMKNNKTAALINATLHKICDATTGSIKIACIGAIPLIEKSIAQGLPPEKTCIEAGLCINKTQNTAQNAENTVTSTPKPVLIHVPLQVQTGPASILKDQVNNVLNQNLQQPGDGVLQGQLQKTSTNNQINLPSIQNQQPGPQLPVQQGTPLQNIQNQQPGPQQRIQQDTPLQNIQNQQPGPQQRIQQDTPLQNIQNQQPGPQQRIQQDTPLQNIQNQQPGPQQRIQQDTPLQNIQNQQPGPQQRIQQDTPLQNIQNQQPGPQQRIQQGTPLQNAQNQQPGPQQPVQQGTPLQNSQNGQFQQPNVQQTGPQNNQIPQNMPQQNVQQGGLQSNQIQQQQNSVYNDAKMGQGHLNLLPKKTSYLPPVQNNQIQQQPVQQTNTFQGMQNNQQIQQTAVQQQDTQNNQIQQQQVQQQQQQQNSIDIEDKMGQGHLNLLPKKTSYLPPVQNNQIQQNAQEPPPNKQTSFTRRNQLLGLMPGPVLLQPNQIGTENKNDKSEDGLQIEKITTQPKQNAPYGQKPVASLSYILGNRRTAFSQLLYKSTTTTSAGSKVLLDAEDGFLDVNKAETEDDDWYHIEDDEYDNDKDDENKNDKQETDNDWNFLTDNDNNDDSMFKDKIDIDEETPNQDQMNLETEWDTDKEKWYFKDGKHSINIPSKPYFRELAVELKTRTNAETDTRLNIIAFYGWILFMSFLMVACIILVRNKYKPHQNGHKQYSWKTAAEEGKSLMKNVYS